MVSQSIDISFLFGVFGTLSITAQITMGKKKKYMAVFDAFDQLGFNENIKNWRPFERYSKVF